MATTTLARLDRRPPDRLILRITPPLEAYHALSSVSDFAPQGKSGPLGSTTGWAATPRLKTLVRSHSGRPPGPLVEKQSLTDRHTQRFGLIRFRYKEGRLRLLTGQQLLWIGSNKNDRNLEALKQIVNGIEPRAAIRELDICQHEARSLLGHRPARFVPGSRNSHDPMAEFLEDLRQIHHDQGLIFDDEGVGRDLACNLLAGPFQ